MARGRLPTVDVKAIYQEFGDTVPEVIRIVRLAGFSLEEATARKWLQRNRITMDGWLLLSTAFEAINEKKLDLRTFLLA